MEASLNKTDQMVKKDVYTIIFPGHVDEDFQTDPFNGTRS
jgi:hypothetical protein